MGRQLELDLPKWGGRRKGAGRPRTKEHPGLVGPGVPHKRKAGIASNHPIHVTQRVQPGVGYLRAYRRAKVIENAFSIAKERFGMRVAHYSIQGNHLHLIVEAENSRALARGMQGLSIRVAKQLNKLAGRAGAVFADRYHSHELRTRRETANAVRYVVGNYRQHMREHTPPRWEDPLSSARFVRQPPDDDAPVARPRTWLLSRGWRLEPPPKRPAGRPA